jgi:hypothetical protein
MLEHGAPLEIAHALVGHLKAVYAMYEGRGAAADRHRVRLRTASHFARRLIVRMRATGACEQCSRCGPDCVQRGQGCSCDCTRCCELCGDSGEGSDGSDGSDASSDAEGDGGGSDSDGDGSESSSEHELIECPECGGEDTTLSGFDVFRLGACLECVVNARRGKRRRR